MYRIKETLEIENQVNFALEIGISKFTLNRILNKKIACSKVIAFSITKHYNEDLEIEDLFEKV